MPTPTASPCLTHRAADAKPGQWWLPSPGNDLSVAVACPRCRKVTALRAEDRWVKIEDDGLVRSGFLCAQVNCMHRVSELRMDGWARRQPLRPIDPVEERGAGRPCNPLARRRKKDKIRES